MTELEVWFCTFNHRYFGGRLKECQVRWVKMKYLGHFTSYQHRGVKAEDYQGPFLIRINSKLKWSTALWQLTLLHEMVHLKLYGKDKSRKDVHSRMFNREMKKLAARGAFVGLW